MDQPCRPSVDVSRIKADKESKVTVALSPLKLEPAAIPDEVVVWGTRRIRDAGVVVEVNTDGLRQGERRVRVLLAVRRQNLSPAKPDPRRMREAGSGTGAGLAVDLTNHSSYPSLLPFVTPNFEYR